MDRAGRQGIPLLDGELKMDEHPVFKVGMSADEVLLVEDASGRQRVKRNELIDEDDCGLVIAWYLTDATLIIRRDVRFGPYRVSEILPASKSKRTITRRQSALSSDEVAAWREGRKKDDG